MNMKMALEPQPDMLGWDEQTGEQCWYSFDASTDESALQMIKRSVNPKIQHPGDTNNDGFWYQQTVRSLQGIYRCRRGMGDDILSALAYLYSCMLPPTSNKDDLTCSTPSSST